MENLYFTPKAFHLVQKNYENIPVDEYLQNTNWIERFHQLTDLNPENHLQSNYQNLKLLTHDLKFLTLILTEQLNTQYPEFKLDNDKKIIIIEILQEGIEQCTPGFHIRVNIAIQSFISPQSISDFLQMIRNQIIENCAHHGEQDIHNNQRYFYVAREEGLGVMAKLEMDPYSNHLNDSNIKLELQNSFHEHYQLFNILRQLKQLFINELPDYTGARTASDSYTMAMYTKALQLIQSILPNQSDYLSFLVIDENQLILDISWKKIYVELIQLFFQQDYIEYRSETQDTKLFFNELLLLIYQPKQISLQRFQQLIGNILPSTTEKIAFLDIIDNLPVDYQLEVVLSISTETIKHYFTPLMEILNRQNELLLAFKSNFKKHHLKFEQQMNIELYRLSLTGLFSKANLSQLTYKMSLLHSSSLLSFYNKINLFQFFSAFQQRPSLLKQQLNFFFSLSPEDLIHQFSRLMSLPENILDLVVSVPKLQSDLVKVLALIEQLDSRILKSKEIFNHQMILKIFDNYPEFVPYLLRYLEKTKTKKEKLEYLTYCIEHCKTVNSLTKCIQKILELHLFNEELNNVFLDDFLCNINHLFYTYYLEMLDIYLHKKTLSNFEKEIRNYQIQLEINEQYLTLLEPGSDHFIKQQQLIEHQRLEIQASLAQQPDNKKFITEQPHAWDFIKHQLNLQLEQLLPYFPKYDWSNLIYNFLLVFVSIPLLGFPLFFRYYQTNGKDIFFPSEISMARQKIIELSDEIPRYLISTMNIEA